MTRPPHLRSGLISATLVVLVVAAWLLARPDPDRRRDELRHHQRHQHGSRASTAATSRVVRPADHYRVGDIIAYRSNDAAPSWSCTASSRSRATASSPRATTTTSSIPITPRAPTWSASSPSASPHGGRVLHWLHTPFMAALLCGGMALLLFMGAKQRRRRRDRRRPLDERGIRQLEPLRTGPDAHSLYDTHEKSIFTTCAVVALVCLAFGALAFTRPTTKPSADKTPYTEKVSFGYHAKALGRARLPRRRREHRRPDLRQARARRPPQGSLPPAGQGAASPRRHHGARAEALAARPAGAAPSSSPRPSASPATTPPPTRRSTCSSCGR